MKPREQANTHPINRGITASVGANQEERITTMRPLRNGEYPINVGSECRVSAFDHMALADFIQTASKTVDLMEMGEVDRGWLTTLTDEEREQFGLPPSAHAVAYWSDGDAESPSYELRSLTIKETKYLTSQCESVLIEAICRHYDALGTDDGHPAHKLHTLIRKRVWPADRPDRIEPEASTAAHHV